jgi:hypothetical protein
MANAAEQFGGGRIDGTRVLRSEWRTLGRLVLEGFGAGILVSLVLALAVFIVTSPAIAATSSTPPGALYLKAQDGSREATPLVFTALPTWLDSPAFARLVQSADGYVLQVHSWEAPRAPDQPFTLCDPERAKRAIAKAERFERPFWVALPTYGYRAWFDAQNRLLGLSAEGPDLVSLAPAGRPAKLE